MRWRRAATPTLTAARRMPCPGAQARLLRLHQGDQLRAQTGVLAFLRLFATSRQRRKRLIRAPARCRWRRHALIMQLRWTTRTLGSRYAIALRTAPHGPSSRSPFHARPRSSSQRCTLRYRRGRCAARASSRRHIVARRASVRGSRRAYCARACVRSTSTTRSSRRRWKTTRCCLASTWMTQTSRRLREPAAWLRLRCPRALLRARSQPRTSC